MVKEILRLNKGSALGMVLVTLSVLSLMGVAILSLSLAGYKVRQGEEKAKASFYLAESGLDQAYGIIAQEVRKAVEKGNQVVNEDINFFLEEEREQERTSKADPLIPNYNSEWLQDNGSGAVEEDYFLEHLNDKWLSLFQQEYREQLNSVLDDNIHNNESNILVNSDKYLAINGVKPVMTVMGPVKIFHPSNLDSMEISISSELTRQGFIQKVQLDYVIKIPMDLTEHYYMEKASIILKDNPLWHNALTSYSDISLAGASTNIQGDIFAYGTIPANKKDLLSFGGVTAGQASDKSRVNGTNVSISGNIFTRANAQVIANSSTMAVSRDAYTENLVIHQGTQDSSITVNGDVYTKDDMEMNGERASIWIKKNYYAFSDGSRATDHDSSSSIVINSPDIEEEDGSSLKIEGDTFLAGTVYINLDSGRYQTGEGVAIAGNYRAYGYLTPAFTGKASEPGVPNDDDERLYELKEYGPLVLIDRFLTGDSFQVLDRAHHFYNVYNYTLSADPQFLLKGNNNAVQIGNVIQSIGAYIDNGTIFSSRYLAEYFEEKRGDCETTYYSKLDQFQNSLSDLFDSDSALEVSEYNDISGNTREMLYVTEQDIALIGQGGNTIGLPPNSLQVRWPGSISKIKGLIITTGDVYLRGMINYRGTIIAGGSIYMEDNNSKNISADADTVRRLVSANSLETYFSYAPSASQTNVVYKAEAGLSEADSSEPYRKYIGIKNWKKL